MRPYYYLLISLIIFNFVPLQGKSINIEKDSVKLEQAFLSSIGNIPSIDSLEIHELKLIKKQNPHYRLEDTYWYNLSKVRFLSGQIDKSFIAAKKGIELNKSRNKEYKTAKFHNLIASVYALKKNNKKAIESFKQALSIIEKKDDKHTAALINNNIANIFFGLSDFKSAYKYSELSYTQLSKEKDTVHLPGVTGILAICALKLNQHTKGQKLAEQSLFLSEKYNNPVGLIVAYHCKAEVSNFKKNYIKAINSFKKSLELSKKYRQSHFIMLNKIGLQRATLDNKEFAKSIEYGIESLEETTQLKNQNTLYSIHRNLGHAYNGLNDTLAFYHLNIAHTSYKESASIESQKSINDMLIKYDSEKKEKELILSRFINLENQNKLIKRAQWITILILALVFILVSYYYYSRIQKQKFIQIKKDQESNRIQSAIEAEEKERERISNELHDGMASVITGVRLKLESISKNEVSEDLQPIIYQLKNLHNETRRISHNLMPLELNSKNWIEKIKQYCEENSNKNFKIFFNQNTKKAIKVDSNVIILIYRSMQEIIHNAQKHSKSKVCYVQISKLDNNLILSIEDEGIGINTSNTQSSQGLNSMQKRLTQVNATLEIETRKDKGTLVTISLNINP